MHRLDDRLGLGAAPNVRLVGGDNQQKAGLLEAGAVICGTGIKLEVIQVGRRVGFSFADHLDVQGAVTIEKNSWT